MAACMPYLCCAVVGYSGNIVLSGVLRGAGRTSLGFNVNIVTLWLVGLPVAVFFGIYLHWGCIGLWVGIAVMNILQVCGVCVGGLGGGRVPLGGAVG